jgi:hypothetical protein
MMVTVKVKNGEFVPCSISLVFSYWAETSENFAGKMYFTARLAAFVPS